LSDAYQVIARKWRPATFADVTGQHHVIQALQNGVRLNKFPNAYIFSGIRGVGKTSIARILARSINCEDGPTPTPCGKCSRCKEILAGTALDVIEIDGASNNGVDEVREMREHLQYAPAKCRMKIYIVDEVHMLSTAAFNAFLKTLEEPPPNTLFIFATTELGKIPDTVLSRCQCFEFRALSQSQVMEKLTAIAKKENITINESALRMVARRADGSMRDGESLLDQVSAYSDGEITEDCVGLVLGLVSRDKIWTLLESIISRDIDTAIVNINELYYSGYDITSIIREMVETVRDMSLVKVMASPNKVLDEREEVIERLKKLVSSLSATRLQQFYDLLLRANQQSRFSGNPLSVVEMTLMKMVRLDDLVPVDDIISKIKGVVKESGASTGQGVSRGSSAVRVDRSSHKSSPPPEVSNKDSDIWSGIKSSVSEVSQSLAAVLESATLDIDGLNAVLNYPSDNSMVGDRLKKDEDLIASKITKFIGKGANVVLKGIGAVSNSASQADKNADKEGFIKMQSHPIVAKAIDAFEGVADVD